MSDKYQTTLVLSRVMNTGVIMSIEKSERELASLEKFLKDESGLPYISLFNSLTGAYHGALWGQDIVEGDRAFLKDPTGQEIKFARWLQIEVVQAPRAQVAMPLKDTYAVVRFDRTNVAQARPLLRAAAERANAVVVDLTGLGFGPCAAVLSPNEHIWKRAERLKIFGAYDLRTMWTQEESEPNVRPMAQFNYRLSPLVAACVKMSLLGSNV